MVKASRKHKGGGGFISKPKGPLELSFIGLLEGETPEENLSDLQRRISKYPVENIIRIDCSENLLRSLPELPPNLDRLYCEHNQLTALPPLPQSLSILICRSNQLTILPTLPTTLIKLDISRNQLTTIPPLPLGLIVFICDGNPLIEPYRTFIRDFYNDENIDLLKQRVNNYHTTPRNNNRSRKNAMVAQLKYMPPLNNYLVGNDGYNYPGGNGYHSATANFSEVIAKKTRKSRRSRKH